MILLDKREKRSPPVIKKEFETVPAVLPAGDMLIGNYYANGFNGNGIEFKLSLKDQQNGDWGLHTEPIERFNDECANKIIPFMIENPKCVFDAIWWVERQVSDHEKKMWDHYCYQYGIWGHIVKSEKAFIQCIKSIIAGEYKRDAIFIKRTHQANTERAKMIRQLEGVSSEKAVKASEATTWDEYVEVFGRKKNGEPTLIALKSFKVLIEFEQWIRQIWKTSRGEISKWLEEGLR